MITLKEISEYALKGMSQHIPTELHEYPYDMDGHCGDGLWKEIQEFWEGFSTDDDVEFVVTGRFMSDEIDLGGGRSYLLSDDKLLDMLFDYMYNTLNWSLSDYQDKIHNSLDITDELEDRYDNISVKRDEKINSIIVDENDEDSSFGSFLNDIKKKKEKKKNIWDSINFRGDFDYIPHVIRYHKSRKDELNSCESIEYLGKSKIDNNFFIYKIKSLGVKIPKGYEVIKPLEDVV